jgi:hypothetical protein
MRRILQKVDNLGREGTRRLQNAQRHVAPVEEPFAAKSWVEPFLVLFYRAMNSRLIRQERASTSAFTLRQHPLDRPDAWQTVSL